MNKKLTAAVLAAAMLLSAAGALATDMTLGEEYRETEDAAAKAKTQSLYDNRPTMLKQAEDLGRGLTAVPSGGGILVSWRYLGTDSADISFNLYRNGEKIAKISDTTNYLDENGSSGDTYRVVALSGGVETDDEDTATAWDKEYISIPVKQF
ncbi:MAG: hypothetical protein LIO53_07740 [Oscillospiraceae bacterium]|nr:hypothetical protein [Oscillospiraceae bacterium]